MYKLEKLAYSFSDLEPFIDTHTLGLHYYKHYQNYLNNLNKILIDNNYSHGYSIIELLKHLNEFSEKEMPNIKFNLGGVINHNIYFQSINDVKVLPEGKLLEEMISTFGSYEKFKDEFIKSALSIRGSGYTFLCMDKDRKLVLINLLNQDTPYFHNLIPLFTVDMWEHAYYINYENKKDIYLNNFFEISSFALANSIYNNI